ncbi:uncharacterized protein L969DRAFT_87535 [Mixia osmundae IAM 14324]|nr:uncharacterized protein L969DRAFT_87535 [Mixia osmundae IAM 14324]KEI39583.1 hypothetical protein L969DRAFT_87535 [Mixia osmundae IAM 14324]
MQGNFGMLLGGLAMVTKNKSAAWLGSIAAISGFLNNLGNLGQSTGSPINGLMMSLLSLVMLYLPQVLDVAAAPVSRPSS